MGTCDTVGGCFHFRYPRALLLSFGKNVGTHLCFGFQELVGIYQVIKAAAAGRGKCSLRIGVGSINYNEK